MDCLDVLGIEPYLHQIAQRYMPPQNYQNNPLSPRHEISGVLGNHSLPNPLYSVRSPKQLCLAYRLVFVISSLLFREKPCVICFVPLCFLHFFAIVNCSRTFSLEPGRLRTAQQLQPNARGKHSDGATSGNPRWCLSGLNIPIGRLQHSVLFNLSCLWIEFVTFGLTSQAKIVILEQYIYRTRRWRKFSKIN